MKLVMSANLMVVLLIFLLGLHMMSVMEGPANGSFSMGVEAARPAAPWPRRSTDSSSHGDLEELSLGEQEKVMALSEDMDSANRELMATDPYYHHW